MEIILTKPLLTHFQTLDKTGGLLNKFLNLSIKGTNIYGFAVIMADMRDLMVELFTIPNATPAEARKILLFNIDFNVMEMLEKKIQQDLVAAIKGHADAAISAIRSIKTAIQNEKVSGTYHELTDNNILGLIQKLAKQRQESIEIYSQAGRQDLADKESAELKALNTYLPQMLSTEELHATINNIISKGGYYSMKDMGLVMKALKERFPNQYDGKTASTYIKEKLS